MVDSVAFEFVRNYAIPNGIYDRFGYTCRRYFYPNLRQTFFICCFVVSSQQPNMKYDYFQKRLEALYLRFKVWFWVAGALIAVAAAASFFLNRGPEADIKRAIAEYHRSRGERIDIQSISFFPVSPGLPDSLRLNENKANAQRLLDLAIKSVRIGAESRAANYRDSAEYYIGIVSDIEKRIMSSRGTQKPHQFTRCQYRATVTTENAKQTGDFDIILDESRAKVWPD